MRAKIFVFDSDRETSKSLLRSHSPSIRSVKEECLSKMILFGETSLRYVLSNYGSHFHTERNHQGKGSVILFPEPGDRIGEPSGEIRTRKRLGGLLRFYYREAA